MILVKAAFDPDAEVWFVESSDLPGLNVEGTTLEDLRAKIPLAVTDLLEMSEHAGEFDVPIEIVAHASAGPRSRRRLRGYGKQVRDLLLASGCSFQSAWTR